MQGLYTEIYITSKVRAVIEPIYLSDEPFFESNFIKNPKLYDCVFITTYHDTFKNNFYGLNFVEDFVVEEGYAGVYNVSYAKEVIANCLERIFDVRPVFTYFNMPIYNEDKLLRKHAMKYDYEKKSFSNNFTGYVARGVRLFRSNGDPNARNSEVVDLVCGDISFSVSVSAPSSLMRLLEAREKVCEVNKTLAKDVRDKYGNLITNSIAEFMNGFKDEEE